MTNLHNGQLDQTSRAAAAILAVHRGCSPKQIGSGLNAVLMVGLNFSGHVPTSAGGTVTTARGNPQGWGIDQLARAGDPSSSFDCAQDRPLRSGQDDSPG